MTDELDTSARAAAALDDPDVRREATAPRAVDPLREAGQAVLRKWRHMAPIQLADYHDERCDCMPCQMGKLEAALAAAPQPAETLAWAVVGEGGNIVPASCSHSKEYASTSVAHPIDHVVRVAIRRVEDEA